MLKIPSADRFGGKSSIVALGQAKPNPNVPMRVRGLPARTEKVTYALKYTHENDCSDDCTPGTERALSLRLQTQIQALLSVEGRRRRKLRARQGCVPDPRSVDGVC
jgi:hypothetical protein